MINGDLCHELLIEKIRPKLSFDKEGNYEAWKRELKEKVSRTVGVGFDRG